MDKPDIRKIIQSIYGWIDGGVRIASIAHLPGMGGSTIARMVSWKLHTEHPVVWISHKNRISELKNNFEILYDIVRKPVLAFVEIPQVMEYDELQQLSIGINQTKKVLFISVGRSNIKHATQRFVLSDWGNAMPNLVEAYQPFVSTLGYNKDVQTKINEALYHLSLDATVEERCPFVVGLTTFDEKYEGIEAYVSKFRFQLNGNSAQKDTLCFLALGELYNRPLLPTQFFKSVFSDTSGQVFSLTKPFKGTGIIGTLICEVIDDQNKSSWKLRHHLLAKQILKTFGGLLSDESNLAQTLYDITVKFIRECAKASNPTEEWEDGNHLYEDTLSSLLIERSNKTEGKYSDLVSTFSDSNKVRIFETLHDLFPNNPHFCSHLARCYALIEKNYEKAIPLATEAIEMSDGNDFLLLNIRADCYRYILTDRVSKAKDWEELVNPKNGLSMSQLVEMASLDYAHTLQRQEQLHCVSVHSYIGHISLLFNAIDAAKKFSGIKLQEMLVRDPYADWWANLQSLIEEFEAQQNNILSDSAEDIQAEISKFRVDTYNLIEDYAAALQIINNQLEKSSSVKIRRLAVLLNINNKSKDKKNYKTNAGINMRLRTLLENNLNEEFSLRDFRPWIEIVRYSKLPIKDVVERLNTWKGRAGANIPLLEFYRYVLNTILGYEGDTLAAKEACNGMNLCRQLRPNNVVQLEYIGCGEDENSMYGSLVTSASDKTQLAEIQGTVVEYVNRGRAYIHIQGFPESFKVFFNPGVARLNDTCLNKEVSFFMSFSFDGPRASFVELKN